MLSAVASALETFSCIVPKLSITDSIYFVDLSANLSNSSYLNDCTKSQKFFPFLNFLDNLYNNWNTSINFFCVIEFVSWLKTLSCADFLFSKDVLTFSNVYCVSLIFTKLLSSVPWTNSKCRLDHHPFSEVFLIISKAPSSIFNVILLSFVIFAPFFTISLLLFNVNLFADPFWSLFIIFSSLLLAIELFFTIVCSLFSIFSFSDFSPYISSHLMASALSCFSLSAILSRYKSIHSFKPISINSAAASIV